MARTFIYPNKAITPLRFKALLEVKEKEKEGIGNAMIVNISVSRRRRQKYRAEVEFRKNRKPNSKQETKDKTLHLFERLEI